MDRAARGAACREFFVAAQMAMALVLLVGAGLMIRSLANLWGVNPGFDPRHVITFSVSYPSTPGATPDAIRALVRQVQDTVAAVPGVESAALSRRRDSHDWRFRAALLD